MRPPTTPPARLTTCGTCAHQSTRYTPTFTDTNHPANSRTTCGISRNRVSPYMTACPLYDRHITPIPPT